MAIELHTIKSPSGMYRKSKRVGRGCGSGRGTYSGRGGKGQTARSGGKKRTRMRAFKPILQKIPKLRGFRSIKPKMETVSLFVLEKATKNGDVVNPLFLKKKGIIHEERNGVKILASGTLTHSIIVKDCSVSKNAVSLIEKTGGKIVN